MMAVRYEQLKEARRIVVDLAREAGRREEIDVFAALIEAKRLMGFSVSVLWPEKFAELMDEQG